MPLSINVCHDAFKARHKFPIVHFFKGLLRTSSQVLKLAKLKATTLASF